MKSFFSKILSWYLEGNKLTRLNKLMWNKLKIVGRLHQIGKKMLFLFSDGLSLMISRLSLISNTSCFHELKQESCQKRATNCSGVKYCK